jgi:hypothetical protein
MLPSYQGNVGLSGSSATRKTSIFPLPSVLFILFHIRSRLPSSADSNLTSHSISNTGVALLFQKDIKNFYSPATHAPFVLKIGINSGPSTLDSNSP